MEENQWKKEQQQLEENVETLKREEQTVTQFEEEQGRLVHQSINELEELQYLWHQDSRLSSLLIEQQDRYDAINKRSQHFLTNLRSSYQRKNMSTKKKKMS